MSPERCLSCFPVWLGAWCVRARSTELGICCCNRYKDCMNPCIVYTSRVYLHLVTRMVRSIFSSSELKFPANRATDHTSKEFSSLASKRPPCLQA
ncbi:hypothetical protein FB446DRAFT_122496 [Lentinula raphanica]|nr:hypothetical protein FB446DRAFT_122496 [Lentinula raphanica]